MSVSESHRKVGEVWARKVNRHWQVHHFIANIGELIASISRVVCDGGGKVTETGSDLALLAAVVSSLRNRVFDHETIIFGEVGLAGEIRPVQSGQERLKEAAKHGFKRAIVPYANAPKHAMGIEVQAVKRLHEVLEKL